ncbi:MAG: GNAT family acetyltransferase [Burkholderiaceae bacterium]
MTTEQTVLIRPFNNLDRKQVVAIWEQSGLTRAWNNPDLDIDRKQKVQPELFLVAEMDEQVVATVMSGYEGHRGWMNYLGVLPAYQRRGIARQLVSAVEALLTAQGCPKLNLQVRAGNAQAVAFYRAIGYQVDDSVSLGKRLIAD